MRHGRHGDNERTREREKKALSLTLQLTLVLLLAGRFLFLHPWVLGRLHALGRPDGADGGAGGGVRADVDVDSAERDSGDCGAAGERRMRRVLLLLLLVLYYRRC